MKSKTTIIHNPIIPGFHPDPSIICVDGVYYIANSTFEWFPGVELYRSEDLVHWKLDGHILTNPDYLDLRGVPNSGGVWAPCLSYDGKKFYLVFSITRTFEEMVQDTDNYLTIAEDIHGPWSKPVYLNSGGFDASLFHDADGRKWLVNMRWDGRMNKNHFPGIVLQEVDVEQEKMVGKPQWIFRGTERGLTEGPHLYQKDGYYYLMTAEGGTSEHHAVTMARSKKLTGPYEEDPSNPVLTSDGRPEHPIQYAGHGDLICDEMGQWYLVHLGSRKSLFHGFSVLGRETFLQKVEWTNDGWLRLCNGTCYPDMEVEICDRKETFHTESEKQENMLIQEQTKSEKVLNGFQMESFYHTYTFEEDTLDPHFMSLRVPLTEKLMSLTERKGYLRLKGRESLLSHHEQAMAAIRIQEPEFAVETCMDYHPEHQWHAAGLLFWYHTANFYYLHVTADEEGNRKLQILVRDNKVMRQPIGEGIPISNEGDIYLKGIFTPDGIKFYYKVDIKQDWNEIILPPEEHFPVTILSDEYANRCGEQGFTGAFTALACQDLTGTGHPVDFAYFSISKIERR